MTKKTTLLLLFVLISILRTAAQLPDEAQVLQKCLDLPVLQEHYPTGEDGTKIPIHIMQYPHVFPTDIETSKFGKPIVFMKRTEIYDNLIDVYFLFKVFSVNGDTAEVIFDYFYDYTTAQQVLEITLSMHKVADGTWEISESSTEKII